MIVVDTNVLAYLYLPGPLSAAAEAWLLRDAQWAAPRLWRSELRNVLSTYMRARLLPLDSAISIHRRAEAVLSDGEYDVEGADVLRLAKESGCSAYDCEFVALADFLNVKLVTADAKLCKAFPARTVMLNAT